MWPLSVVRLRHFRLFSTAGAGFGYFGDPLLGSDPEPVAQAIIDHIGQLVSRGTAAVYLRRILSDGVMLDALSQRVDVACWPLGPDEVNSVVHYDRMLDCDQYFAQVSRKHAVPRRSRRLAEHLDHIEYVVDDPKPEVALDTMRDMLQRRFQSDLRIFRTPSNRALIRDLVRELFAGGHARVSSLMAGGRRVTVTIDLHAGPKMFWYAVAYEPELADFGLGHIELYRFLHNAHASGAVEVDLGSAGFPYKRRWANAESHRRTVAVTTLGWPGRLANSLRRATIRVHRSRRFNGSDNGGLNVV